MRRHFLGGLCATALLLGAGTVAVYPLTAVAQQPESQQTFNRRMGSRIDAVQSQVKSLQRELRGDDEESSGGDYTAMSGIERSLETVDEQCRELERDLMRMSIGSSYDEYQRQRQIEYYVRGLEQQVHEIRKYMRQSDEQSEDPAAKEPEPEPEDEDGISDEDWAAEWAKGDRQ